MSTSPTRKKEAGARVRYNPRSEDIGAVIERYGIPEFTYHTWRNPELELRYESSSPTASSELVKESARLSHRNASRPPLPASPSGEGDAVGFSAPVVAPPQAPVSAPVVSAVGAPAMVPTMAAARTPVTAPVSGPVTASEAAHRTHKSAGKQGSPAPATVTPVATLSEKGSSMRVKAPAAATPVLVAWNEPEDLMKGPLPLLSHQPDCRAWVRSLADRPARAVVSIAEPVSYQESRHLHAISTLEEEPMPSFTAQRPSQRTFSQGVSASPEEPGLRLITSVEMHASHPIGKKEDAYEIYPPLPRGGAQHQLEASRPVEDVLRRFLPDYDESHQGHVSLSSILTRPEPGAGKPISPRITGGPRRPLKRASQPAGVEGPSETGRAGAAGTSAVRGGVAAGPEVNASVSAPTTRHPLAPRISRPTTPVRSVQPTVAAAPAPVSAAHGSAAHGSAPMPGSVAAAPIPVMAPASSVSIPPMAQGAMGTSGAVVGTAPVVAPAPVAAVSSAPTVFATSPAAAKVAASASTATVAPVTIEARALAEVVVPSLGGSVEASAAGGSVSQAATPVPVVAGVASGVVSGGAPGVVSGRAVPAVTSPAHGLSATAASPPVSSPMSARERLRRLALKGS